MKIDNERRTDWQLMAARLKRMPIPVMVFALLVLVANLWFLYQLRDTIVGQIIIGGILLAATLYLFHLFRASLSQKAPIEAIGSFQIIGGEKAGEQSGNAMAHLLRARLGKIRTEMESVTQSLNEVAGGSDRGRIRSLEPASSRVSIPTEVFEPLQLDFSVAGVEVGGLLAGIQRLLQRGHLLRIVVEYQEGQAIVGGNIDLFGGRSLYMIAAPDTNEIITKIAYALAQTEMKARIPKMGELGVDDFRDLMVTLTNLNELNKNAKSSEAASTAYQALLPNINSLVDKLPDWRPLLRLAAEVSINAKRLEEAVNFYNMELTLLEEDDPDYAKLRSLTETLATGSRSDTELGVTPSETAPNFESLLKRLRKTAGLETIYKMLGLSSWADEKAPRIAILGGLPSAGLLPASNQVVVGAPAESPPQRPGVMEYIDSLVQTVRLVTSNAIFYFTPMLGDTDYFTQEEITGAWLALNSEAPDVLLVTLGPLDSFQLQQLIEDSIFRRTLVIVPEIPQEWGQQFGDITQEVMTVAAVGLNGGPLAPTLGGSTAHEAEQLFWAPGENIPIVHGEDQRVEPRYGHIYASAIAAGVAGRLSACAPSLSVKKRLMILRDTSQVVALDNRKAMGAGEATPPRVINLSAAMAKALEALTPAGNRFEMERTMEIEIPDNDSAGIESLIEVEVVGKLKRIAIVLDITHTYIGDLRVTIVTPDGAQVVLHDRQGASRNNLIVEYSSDEIASLAALTGTEITGAWTLQVADMAGGDVGQFHHWALRIDYD